MRGLVCVVVCITLASVSVAVKRQRRSSTNEEHISPLPLPKPTNVSRPNRTEVLEKSQLSHENGKLTEVKHFYLWTRNTAADTPEVLDPTNEKNIKNSLFKSRKTYIIIHGFLGWGTEEWILSLKDKLLKLSDCNVIAVDWPAGRTVADYYTVVYRVVYVAEDTSFLLQKLRGIKGLGMNDVHAIGHSLGAHISGLTAKSAPSRFGRITGLDPAGLMYHNVPPVQRLDAGDADYVDVLHTNGCYNFWNPWLSCYGINENLGHTDFWPNGGKHQPACHGDVEGELGCDHMMSYKYFLESIDYGIEDTFFLARNCVDWSSYKSGNCSCSDGAQYMGFYANAEMPGIFYLNTNSSSPYAERDAVCAPGKTVDYNIVNIAASTGSGLLILIFIVVVVVLIRRRNSRMVSSGLLIEEDDADILGQEDDVVNYGAGGSSVLAANENAGTEAEVVTPADGDDRILVF